MARKYNGGLPIAVGFDLQSNRPMDEREIVSFKADLATLENCYAGIGVKVEEEGYKLYIWNGLDQTNLDNWNEIEGGDGPGGGGDMYKSTYDTNNNGTVDNSEKLGGQNASYYDQSAHVADQNIHLQLNERDALNAATPMSGTNPVATISDISDAGGGDMNKAQYDQNDNGIVDNAENLGGQPPSAYDQSAHVTDTNNPHSVTKAQVGLGNADNTSDADKPISTATQAALDGKVNLTGDETVAGEKTFSDPLRATGQDTVPWEGDLVATLQYLYDNYQPLTQSGLAGENLAPGDIVYESGVNTWSKASAAVNAQAQSRLGIVMSGGNTGQQIGVSFFTTKGGSGLTPGTPRYLSDTPGAWTNVAPTGSSIVRVIGADVLSNLSWFSGMQNVFISGDGSQVNGVPIHPGGTDPANYARRDDMNTFTSENTFQEVTTFDEDVYMEANKLELGHQMFIKAINNSHYKVELGGSGAGWWFEVVSGNLNSETNSQLRLGDNSNQLKNYIDWISGSNFGGTEGIHIKVLDRLTTSLSNAQIDASTDESLITKGWIVANIVTLAGNNVFTGINTFENSTNFKQQVSVTRGADNNQGLGGILVIGMGNGYTTTVTGDGAQNVLRFLVPNGAGSDDTYQMRYGGATQDDDIVTKGYADLNYAQGESTDYVTTKTAAEPAGADKVPNIVSLTQAEYDAGNKVADTFYIITNTVFVVGGPQAGTMSIGDAQYEGVTPMPGVDGWTFTSIGADEMERVYLDNVPLEAGSKYRLTLRYKMNQGDAMLKIGGYINEQLANPNFETIRREFTATMTDTVELSFYLTLGNIMAGEQIQITELLLEKFID